MDVRVERFLHKGDESRVLARSTEVAGADVILLLSKSGIYLSHTGARAQDVSRVRGRHFDEDSVPQQAAIEDSMRFCTAPGQCKQEDGRKKYCTKCSCGRNRCIMYHLLRHEHALDTINLKQGITEMACSKKYKHHEPDDAP